MPTIKHILFPFDFSDQSSVAAPFVRAIANQYGARVSVLSVIPPVWKTHGELRLQGTDTPEHELAERLDQALAKEFEGIVTGRLTDVGDPALKIIEFAHLKNVDLIMMPTFGIGGYRNMLLGSTAVKVLHQAKCPVWTATHAEEHRSTALPGTIMCAVEDNSHIVTLLQWASEFSQKMGAKLKLLHVVPPVSNAHAVFSEKELREGMRTKLTSLQQSVWVEAPLQVVVGQIAETIAKEARHEGADLILIGRGLLSSAMGRLRSNAYAIIHQSPCPVVSV